MKLKTWPNAYLTSKSQDVPWSQIQSYWVSEIIKEMKEVMTKENGIGIAANQLGFISSIIIVEDTIMINPYWVVKSHETEIGIEGCLSVPNKVFNVRRSSTIIVEYLDENRKTCRENLAGLRSRIFQHELDHLTGITLENNKNAEEIKRPIY